MKVFLDDVRCNEECLNYMYHRIGSLNPIYDEIWSIVRNYDDFIELIKNNYKIITHISFDHDLADIHYDPKTWTESFKYHEKTGYDCAKWLKQFYEDNKIELPIMFVHSMNPVGTEKIIKLFK